MESGCEVWSVDVGVGEGVEPDVKQLYRVVTDGGATRVLRQRGVLQVEENLPYWMGGGARKVQGRCIAGLSAPLTSRAARPRPLPTCHHSPPLSHTPVTQSDGVSGKCDRRCAAAPRPACGPSSSRTG